MRFSAFVFPYLPSLFLSPPLIRDNIFSMTYQVTWETEALVSFVRTISGFIHAYF